MGVLCKMISQLRSTLQDLSIYMKKTFTKTINTLPISATRLLLLACLLAFAGNTYATIRYVKAAGTGNGTSWQDVSNNFQDMINAKIQLIMVRGRVAAVKVIEQ